MHNDSERVFALFLLSLLPNSKNAHSSKQSMRYGEGRHVFHTKRRRYIDVWILDMGTNLETLVCTKKSILIEDMAKSAAGGGSEKLVRGEKLVYIDLDFNDSRNAYKRAVDFVSSNSIKYALSSNILTELGGREILSVPELFANDFVWSAANPGRVITSPQRATRLIFSLDPVNSPLACENFLALCTGSKGISKNSHLLLSYLNTRIHRYHGGLGIIQGGDIQFGNGSGGESIWGKKFKDDANGLKLRHNKRGILSMGNGGKNSNTSQFFVTLKDQGAPVCDRKHVVFGKLKYGFDTLDLMHELIDAALADGNLPPAQAGEDEFPPINIVITGCGEWKPGGGANTTDNTGGSDSDSDIIQGYYDESGIFRRFQE